MVNNLSSSEFFVLRDDPRHANGSAAPCVECSGNTWSSGLIPVVSYRSQIGVIPEKKRSCVLRALESARRSDGLHTEWDCAPTDRPTDRPRRPSTAHSPSSCGKHVQNPRPRHVTWWRIPSVRASARNTSRKGVTSLPSNLEPILARCEPVVWLDQCAVRGSDCSRAPTGSRVRSQVTDTEASAEAALNAGTAEHEAISSGHTPRELQAPHNR